MDQSRLRCFRKFRDDDKDPEPARDGVISSASTCLPVLDTPQEAQPLACSELKYHARPILRIPGQHKRVCSGYFDALACPSAGTALAPGNSGVPVGLRGR